MSHTKRDLFYRLKYDDTENFEIVNNIIVSKDAAEIGARFDKYSQHPPENIRAQVSETFKKYFLSNISYFGISGTELFKKEMRQRRCHGTVLLFSLCLDKFEWVFGNLKAIGASSVINSALDEDEALLTTNLRETKDYNTIEPTFNHSFLKVKGFDLIASGLIDETTLASEFVFNPNETYVVDPTFDTIMNEKNYNKIMQPEYFYSLNQDDLEKRELYQLLKTQSKSENFGFDDYVKLFTQTQIDTKTNKRDFLSLVVSNEMFNMLAHRNQTIDEFKQILLTELMFGNVDFMQK